MDLNTQDYPIRRVLQGTDSVALTDGRLKITAGEQELLNEKVPTGKSWRITLQVKIEES